MRLLSSSQFFSSASPCSRAIGTIATGMAGAKRWNGLLAWPRSSLVSFPTSSVRCLLWGQKQTYEQPRELRFRCDCGRPV